VSARRGTSGLSGILLIDKPQGLTSHDVVNRVRRATGERRVGHAGTLDPMATGLLVVLVGPATRLAPYLTAATKSYSARITFGAETDTDDAEGRVTATAEPPAILTDTDAAAQTVASLVGTHEQVPPAFSAIKRDGVTAYEAARRGDAIEIEPRSVEISAARLVGVHAEPPSWDVELTVSKGTYIRAIARDLGRSLCSAAHLSALRRTGSGALDLADAVPLALVESTEDPAEVARHFTDPIHALGLPVVRLSADAAERVANGSTLTAGIHTQEALPAEGLVAIAFEDRLLAVYAVSGGILKANVVIPGGVSKGD
jgi:tRNA pseudouridine55 synthase